MLTPMPRRRLPSAEPIGERIWEREAAIENYQAISIWNGGEGGIRTPDGLAPMPHFECGAFNHSATSPWRQADGIASLRRRVDTRARHARQARPAMRAHNLTHAGTSPDRSLDPSHGDGLRPGRRRPAHGRISPRRAGFRRFWGRAGVDSAPRGDVSTPLHGAGRPALIVLRGRRRSSIVPRPRSAIRKRTAKKPVGRAAKGPAWNTGQNDVRSHQNRRQAVSRGRR